MADIIFQHKNLVYNIEFHLKYVNIGYYTVCKYVNIYLVVFFKHLFQRVMFIYNINIY